MNAGLKKEKEKAITALTDAAAHYKRWISLSATQHIGVVWLNRVGNLNFEAQIKDVMKDIEIAKQIKVSAIKKN